MGKTALAMNIVEWAVIGCKTPSLVFSMEMSSEQLVMRLLSSLARIGQSDMQTGKLKDQDWDRFSAAVAQLKDQPLYIDDTPALTPASLARPGAPGHQGGRWAPGPDRGRLPATDEPRQHPLGQPYPGNFRNLPLHEGHRKEMNCP